MDVKINDFIRSTDGLVRGIVIKEGAIFYKRKALPAYIVHDGQREHIIPADSVQVIKSAIT